MFRLVALSLLVLLSAPLLAAYHTRPSPIYYAPRRPPPPPPTNHPTPYVQPYHPGLVMPANDLYPAAKSPFSRRFIKDADFAGSGSGSHAYKSPHKRKRYPPNTSI
jgi:hypothetical protein